MDKKIKYEKSTNIQIIKEQISAKEVAEFYGYYIKYNKMSCPMHKDEKPSLSFKNGRFKCFSCDNGGSSIDFCMMVFNLPFKEACAKLNANFNLGLDIDIKLKKSKTFNKEAKRLHSVNAIVKKFEKWEKDAFHKLCSINHILNNYKKQYAPKTEIEEWDNLFCFALSKQCYIEYLIEILMYGTFEEKVAQKRIIDKEVIEFGKRTKGTVIA